MFQNYAIGSYMPGNEQKDCKNVRVTFHDILSFSMRIIEYIENKSNTEFMRPPF